MLPDRVSNPGPLTYESGTLPIELRGPAERHSDPAEPNAESWHLKIIKPKSDVFLQIPV